MIDVSSIPSTAVAFASPFCNHHQMFMLVKSTDRVISPDGTVLTVTRRCYCPLCFREGEKHYIKVPNSIKAPI